MGIVRPRIAVSGLQSWHAGEHGMFGNEEIDIIAARDRGCTRKAGAERPGEGPFGADTMFQKPGYDAFVVMVHRPEAMWRRSCWRPTARRA